MGCNVHMTKIHMSFERAKIQWSHIGIAFNLCKFKYTCSTNKQHIFPHTIWLPNMNQLLELLPNQVIFSGAGEKLAILDFWDTVQYK